MAAFTLMHSHLRNSLVDQISESSQMLQFFSPFCSIHATLLSQMRNLLFSISVGYQIVYHRGNHFIISRIGFVNNRWRKLSALDSGG